MKIRLAGKNDFKSCVVIAKSLPEWFDENEVLEISKHLFTLKTFVVVENEEVLAFAILEDKYKDTIEIKHLAVSRSHQHAGIGTNLISYIEKSCPDKTNIEVKTLDESADYEPYMSTRSFYEKNGFKKAEVIDPHPGWGPGNPCAVYKKTI
jgi:N-acetylglutamate synthase-like GNAT family acetyltransferase